MTATLVRSRLSCKRERAGESEPKPHGGWRSLTGEEKGKGRSAESPWKGGNAVSHCWCDGLWETEGWKAGGPSCLRQPGLILPPRGTQSCPRQSQVPSAWRDPSPGAGCWGQICHGRCPGRAAAPARTPALSGEPGTGSPSLAKPNPQIWGHIFPPCPPRLVPPVLLSDGALQCCGSHGDTERLLEWFLFSVCF